MIQLACAVCGGGGGASDKAYLDMTIFLSLLPLTLIGGIAGVVWYLTRLAAAQEAPPSEPAPLSDPRTA